MLGAKRQTRPRILILEDEDPLRRLMEEILGIGGYPFQSARSAPEALALWRRELAGSAPFRLALADLSLGSGSNGVQFALALRELDPTARLVVCSGDAAAPAVLDPCQFGFDASVAKPFQIETLLQILARVLPDPLDSPGPPRNAHVEFPRTGCPTSEWNAKLPT